jgi:hypothetical protein
MNSYIVYMHQTHIGGVELNMLPALAALLDGRRVSRAAARVGLSQQTMSRALQRLGRIFDDAPARIPALPAHHAG